MPRKQKPATTTKPASNIIVFPGERSKARPVVVSSRPIPRAEIDAALEKIASFAELSARCMAKMYIEELLESRGLLEGRHV